MQWRPLRLVCRQWKDVADRLVYSHLAVPTLPEARARVEQRLEQMDHESQRWKYLNSLSLYLQGGPERLQLLVSEKEKYYTSLLKRIITGKSSVIRQLALDTRVMSYLLPPVYRAMGRLPLISPDLSGIRFGIG